MRTVAIVTGLILAMGMIGSQAAETRSSDERSMRSGTIDEVMYAGDRGKYVVIDGSRYHLTNGAVITAGSVVLYPQQLKSSLRVKYSLDYTRADRPSIATMKVMGPPGAIDQYGNQ